MHDGHSGNAMTEIALALAMGFFSLMVLTLVSMGAGPGPTMQVSAIRIVPAAKESSSPKGHQIGPEEQLVLFYNGHFLDKEMRPIDPESLDEGRRTILALSPEISLSDAMAARSRLATTNLTVTALDERWLNTLKETTP